MKPVKSTCKMFNLYELGSQVGYNNDLHLQFCSMHFEFCYALENQIKIGRLCFYWFIVQGEIEMRQKLCCQLDYRAKINSCSQLYDDILEYLKLLTR